MNQTNNKKADTQTDQLPFSSTPFQWLYSCKFRKGCKLES